MENAILLVLGLLIAVTAATPLNGRLVDGTPGSNPIGMDFETEVHDAVERVLGLRRFKRFRETTMDNVPTGMVLDALFDVSTEIFRVIEELGCNNKILGDYVTSIILYELVGKHATTDIASVLMKQLHLDQGEQTEALLEAVGYAGEFMEESVGELLERLSSISGIEPGMITFHKLEIDSSWTLNEVVEGIVTKAIHFSSRLFENDLPSEDIPNLYDDMRRVLSEFIDSSNVKKMRAELMSYLDPVLTPEQRDCAVNALRMLSEEHVAFAEDLLMSLRDGPEGVQDFVVKYIEQVALEDIDVGMIRDLLEKFLTPQEIEAVIPFFRQMDFSHAIRILCDRVVKELENYLTHDQLATIVQNAIEEDIAAVPQKPGKRWFYWPWGILG